MAHPLEGFAIAAAVLVLAGCLSGPTGPEAPTETPSPPAPGPQAGDCDAGAPALPLLPRWASHGGAWSGFLQPDAGRPQGIRGVGDAADPGLALLVDHGTGPYRAVDIQVGFTLVSGQHPDGAGLAFHWSGDSYNLVRYSPSELGWHLFTVIDGNRSKADLPPAADAPAGPQLCDWVTLRVVADGPAVKAYQDGTLVLEASLPEGAAVSGQAALFLRGDSVALFEGYAIEGS